MNDEIRKPHQMGSQELRRIGGGTVSSKKSTGISLKLSYHPPLQWAALIRFLSARATPGVEAADPKFYRRTICLHGTHGLVEVRPAELGKNWLLVKIQIGDATALNSIVERLRRIFDLDANSTEVDGHLQHDQFLDRIVHASPGTRVPGAWDGFELAVRAILGQQVSVKAATTLAGRLAQSHGERLSIRDDAANVAGLRFLFPRPIDLAESDVSTIGLPRARAAAIKSLSIAVAEGKLALDSSQDVPKTIESLTEIPGIGEWTAQYIAMRALRDPDAFPATDLGLQRALATGAHLPTKSELLKRAEPWRPWRAYAAMYLWSRDAMTAANGETLHGV